MKRFNVKLIRGKFRTSHTFQYYGNSLVCVYEREGGGGRAGRGGESDTSPLLPRVLQWSTFIDRTFCTETEDERRSWIESMHKVSKDLTKKQKEEAPSSMATGGLKPAEGVASPKQGIKVRERERERESYVGVAVQIPCTYHYHCIGLSYCTCTCIVELSHLRIIIVLMSISF